ncbi:hypothetical protein K7640_02195 [Micromonospora sp. PLK6-60]|uniref:hypothetical protein n=1 Tax=Micromonospora sp. PLK6-60 TaxID=2873383 RepID=UPI001CA7229D|nr:hypothetical protein [Micromonospora sp. PLK6-60]MBY8870651.1 hypothetical protein [Micromonospora sp. PLK6-60]
MSAGFGLSSGSAPALAGAALADLVRECGGDTVDLRAGKGHGWEADGLTPFTERGVRVAFVGISVALGDPRHTPEDVARLAGAWPGRPVKVFADVGAAAAGGLVAAQVAALATGRNAADVLVETHHGRALPAELRELHDRYGLRVVLDTAGLAATTDDPAAALGLLRPAVAAVQVKGFRLRPAGGSDHHPLGPDDLAELTALFRALPPDGLPVTVESRAGTPRSDLRHTVAAWSRAHHGR